MHPRLGLFLAVSVIAHVLALPLLQVGAPGGGAGGAGLEVRLVGQVAPSAAGAMQAPATPPTDTGSSGHPVRTDRQRREDRQHPAPSTRVDLTASMRLRHEPAKPPVTRHDDPPVTAQHTRPPAAPRHETIPHAAPAKVPHAAESSVATTRRLTPAPVMASAAPAERRVQIATGYEPPSSLPSLPAAPPGTTVTTATDTGSLLHIDAGDPLAAIGTAAMSEPTHRIETQASTEPLAAEPLPAARPQPPQSEPVPDTTRTASHTEPLPIPPEPLVAAASSTAASESVAPAAAETGIAPTPASDAHPGKQVAASLAAVAGGSDAVPFARDGDPGGGDTALRSLLHQAIDKHKRYPSLARRHRREGIATVLFHLHPDGALDGLQLATSSGFDLLDQAALQAVADVAPFTPAERYLTRATRFRVDVQFRLF